MNKKFNSQSINNVDYLTSNSKMEYNDNGDGNCDPDLEARLYAEIYYSNETYPDDNTTNINTPSSSNATVGQSTPRSLNNDKSNSEKNACNWSFDARPGQENVCSTTYSVNNKNPMGMECQSPSIEPYSRATGMFRKPYRPTKNSFQSPHKQDHLKSSNESPRYSRRNDEQYRNDNRTTRSGQRFQNTPSNESYLQLEAPRRSKRLRCQDEQFQRLKEINKIKRKKQKEKNMKIRKQGQHFNINDPDSHFVEDMSDGELGDVSFLALAESIDQTVENNTPDTVNNKSRFDKQTSCSTPKASSDKSAGKKQNNSVVQENSIIESENTSLNNSVIDASLSKYNVLDKNKKIQEQSDDLNKNQSNNNNGNESDSDGSIWEVPVPPKPAPPLIDLPDSDDELNNTNNNNNSTSSSSSSDEDEEEEQQSLSQTIDESFDITNSTQDHDDDDDDDELIDGNENSQDEPEISSNIILNCTTVQRGASSLDEIKRMRELTVTNCTQDDEDSMTESEAMNWLSIEDQMANDEEVRKKNKSHGDDTESWQNFDDSINISNSNDQNISSGDDCTINDNNNPTTSQDNINQENLVINNSSVTENIDSNTLNEEMGPPKTTEMLKKRKRNHNLSNESDNNSSKSSSPQKRQKQNKKSTANMSFDEYIFQPLPQDLVSFYNDDRSGLMNLEVSEIQCRMTRNPNLWAILDADMISSRRRFSRVTCSICQKEGHKKDHCPSKPNVMSCRMCGQVGHKESTCPHTMCLTCGKKYQSYRKTCEVCKLLRCTTCRGIGHDKTQCPDLWRKYHMTTTGGSVNVPENSSSVMKPKYLLSCSICRRKGHDGSSCNKRNNLKHFITPSFVTNYYCDASVETVTLSDSDDNDEHQKNTPEIMIISDTSDSDSSDDDDDEDDDDDYNLSSSANSQQNNWDIDDDEIVEVPVVKKIHPVFAVSDSDDDFDSSNVIDEEEKEAEEEEKESEKEKDNCNNSLETQQSLNTINQTNECTDVVESLSNNHENIPNNNDGDFNFNIDNIQESNDDLSSNIDNRLNLFGDYNLINDNEEENDLKPTEKKSESCDDKVVDKVTQSINETVGISKTEKTVEELNDIDKKDLEIDKLKVEQEDEKKILSTEETSDHESRMNIDNEILTNKDEKITAPLPDSLNELNDNEKPSLDCDLDGIDDTVESRLEKNCLTKQTEVNLILHDTTEIESSASTALKIDTNIIAKETDNLDGDVKLKNNFEKSQCESEELLENVDQSTALDSDNFKSQQNDTICSVNSDELTSNSTPD